MSDKVKARKAALREKLIDLAEARISEQGLAGLRARDLAAEAGCAVGAIYNVFDDLTALVLAVNGRTFQRLGRAVAAVSGDRSADPRARLVAMSHGYLHFAAEHTALWRALFEVEMSVSTDVPEWYMQALGALFALIKDPLSQIYPDKPEAELDLLTRALFSSVHGIVLLGLQQRISAVPVPHIESMIAQILGEVGNT